MSEPAQSAGDCTGPEVRLAWRGPRLVDQRELADPPHTEERSCDALSTLTPGWTASASMCEYTHAPVHARARAHTHTHTYTHTHTGMSTSHVNPTHPRRRSAPIWVQTFGLSSDYLFLLNS